MADPEYFLRDGEVWFRRSTSDEHHVCGGSQKLSVAMDVQDGILHKHGSEVSVSKWWEKYHAKIAAHPEMAELFPIEVVTFPINQAVLDELNLCIATSSRIARFTDFLKAQSADDFGPIYPE